MLTYWLWCVYVEYSRIINTSTDTWHIPAPRHKTASNYSLTFEVFASWKTFKTTFLDGSSHYIFFLGRFWTSNTVKGFQRYPETNNNKASSTDKFFCSSKMWSSWGKEGDSLRWLYWENFIEEWYNALMNVAFWIRSLCNIIGFFWKVTYNCPTLYFTGNIIINSEMLNTNLFIDILENVVFDGGSHYV